MVRCGHKDHNMKGVHDNHASGSRIGRWNNEKMISAEGYVKIRVGVSHPLADPNGYTYEHKLVIVSAYGIEALEGKIIHHKNDDKTDNRIENLQLVSGDRHTQITIMENRIRHLEKRVTMLEAENVLLRKEEVNNAICSG